MVGFCSFTAGGQVASLIRELGSHKPCGVAKKEKKRKKDSWKHSTDLGSDFSKRGHIHTYITTKENIPWAEYVHICASGTCTPKYTQSHTGKGRDTNQLESAETSP